MRELIEKTHCQWHELLEKALACVDKNYLAQLQQEQSWLPGKERLFAAFNDPLDQVNYLLLGESPYPRPQSANGFAFWDNAVDSLWSSKGLSKEVNRATSLRNMLKMLLVARGDLNGDCSQPAIANLDKSSYWQTLEQLFNAMRSRGFLLLNACLVYDEGKIAYHARQWQPFISSILNQLAASHNPIQLLLFGKIAAQVDNKNQFKCLICEHPYNLSFIHNPDVLTFYKPLDLLRRHEY